MSDEAALPENPPTATTPTAAAAQQPAASVLETPEVRAAIAAAEERARNATWKQARETLGKKQNGAAPTTTESPTAAQPAATATAPTSSLDIARVVMFTTEAAKHGVPAKGVELLLSRLDAEKPSDVSAWVAQQASDFGWKPSTPTTNTPATQATAPAPAPHAAANMPPVTGTGAPSSTSRATDDIPLIDRSAAEQAAFFREKGLVEFTNRVTREARERGTRLRLR